MPTSSTSAAKDEINLFSKLAPNWWDQKGTFASLHKLNPLRCSYIIEQIAAFQKNISSNNLSLLDVGCGGGLLAEVMARSGMNVTAIDASEAAIQIASKHAKENGLSIDYKQTTPEKLAEQGATFDIITAMEIVEHVSNRHLFMASLSHLLKPNGILFMSTVNKTLKSYGMAIVAAEYVLNWIPPGTHDWEKFISPSTLTQELATNGLETKNLTGVIYKPITRRFVLNPHKLDVNYMLCAQKTDKNAA